MDLGSGSLAGLPRLRRFRRQRLSSWDRSGGNRDAIQIPPGETAVLGEIEGAGCIRHLWMTMMSLPSEPHELRQTVLRMFWDGESSPSVEAPLGDFFGIGFGLRRNFVSLPRIFAELARVIAAGGRVALLEVDRPTPRWLRSSHSFYFDRVVPLVGGLLSDRRAYASLPQSTVYLPPTGELLGQLAEAGFCDVVRRPLLFGAAQLVTATRRDES